MADHWPYDLDSLFSDSQVDKPQSPTTAAAKAEWTESIKWLMGSTQGRRFVSQLLRTTGSSVSVFKAKSDTTAFFEGRRTVGLQLIRTIDAHCLDERTQMIREEHERNRTRTNGHLTKR
jgi:hypothetical protein